MGHARSWLPTPSDSRGPQRADYPVREARGEHRDDQRRRPLYARFGSASILTRLSYAGDNRASPVHRLLTLVICVLLTGCVELRLADTEACGMHISRAKG